jgi:3-dehydroquinate dehydratase / shikimate dehydrogenase
MSRATLVATISSFSRANQATNSIDWRAINWLEVRADLMPEVDPVALRSVSDAKFLYTLRSRRAGGMDGSAEGARFQCLRRAARHYDFIDLEAERDLLPNLLSCICPSRRVISWYGKVRDEQTLEQLLGTLGRNSARLYRFELTCSTVEEGIIAVQFLSRIKRADVIAYATGPLGVWTRVLAARIGAPIVFGELMDDREHSAGNPTISELIQDYGFPEVQPVTEIFAIAGEPILGSLSPRLHNAAHRASGAGRVFLSFPTSALDRLWSRLVSSGTLETLGLTVKGLTVAAPNKQSALQVSGRIAPLCRQCKASNLLVRENGHWAAGTTEPEGIFHHDTVKRLNLSGATVAVVGCGGSGRVTAAALAQKGAEVTLVNRSVDHGKWAGRLLGLRFVPLKDFSAHGYSAMVNATPVGREGDELPVDLKSLNPGSLVVDLVYRRNGLTPLVAAAEGLGHAVIDGRNVLLAQTMRQYCLMTGEHMPEGRARKLLGIPADRPDALEPDPPAGMNAHAEAERC